MLEAEKNSLKIKQENNLKIPEENLNDPTGEEKNKSVKID